jgi:beta-lactamase class A
MDVASGERAFAGDDGWFPTASAAKLPLHSALGLAVADGRARWHEPATVREEDLVGDDGVVACLTLPVTLPLRDFARLMLVVSDNSATNVVIRRLGIGAINEAFQAFGLAQGLILRRPVQAAAPTGEDVFARARAETLLDYLAMLAQGRLAGAEETLAVARRQSHTTMLPRLLPVGEGDDEPLWVANKPGADAGHRADLGIVRGLGRHFTFVMMVTDCPDRGFPFDHPAERLIAECARLTFDALAP